MIEFVVGVIVGVTVIVLGAMAWVMVGNWRYHKFVKNDRMTDVWLQRHARVARSNGDKTR